MIDERESFDETKRVTFPNYMSQQPVQTHRGIPRQLDQHHKLPDQPLIETNHHKREEQPTLVRYEDDQPFQKEFDTYVAADSFKKYQRQPFQVTPLPKPRSGIGPAKLDTINYQPYIDYLTRPKEALIYFVANEEEK
ncbi:hypothetical protein [Atopobacter phocae]|uniref:hypothetical protein n=1 Tax=Atopobacter phocae TaxID=136492 RepID=UPI00046E9D2D|nr:hypothetical protein [Atopobacter phocae]